MYREWQQKRTKTKTQKTPKPKRLITEWLEGLHMCHKETQKVVSTVRLEGPPHMRWGESAHCCVLPLQLCRSRYVSENMVLLLPNFCYLEEPYWNHQPNQLPVIVDRGTLAVAGFQSYDGNCSVVDCRPPIHNPSKPCC